MSRIEQLYQDMILEHNRKPRNFREVEGATHQAHGINPLCGDDYNLYLTLKDGHVEDVGFQGHGCAISKSSASLLTTKIKGKPMQDVLKLKDCFIDLVTNECSQDCQACLGALKVFEGVKKYPIRVKCAALIWRALEAALARQAVGALEVTTETPDFE